MQNIKTIDQTTQIPPPNILNINLLYLPNDLIPSNKLFILSVSPPMLNLTWASVTLKNTNLSLVYGVTSLMMSMSKSAEKKNAQ